MNLEFRLYPGLPLWVQLALLGVLALIAISTLNVLVLAAYAARTRRRNLPASCEDEFLWIFFIPALNEEVTIADSVSRLAQTQATNKLIVVINDGSDDGTTEVLAGLDVPDLRILHRELPNARRGKAAALNAAWRHVSELLKAPDMAQWTSDKVIVVIVDADGRLSPNAPAALSRHFIDPRIAGVQSLVRIYNRRGILTWAQDVEFAVFGRLFQLGRTWWGTANMGGNGQANRLQALNEVAVEDGPWRDRLTEDQDIGVRLLQARWHGAQDLEATVEQQGLSSLRRLYRQRTRWSQGGWEAMALLPSIHRYRASALARLDATLYLLTPIVQLITGVAFISAVFWAVYADVSLFARTWPLVVFYLAMSFTSGVIGLLSRARGVGAKLLTIVLIVPYTVYAWLIFPVVVRALARLALGRETWAKTAREPIEPGITAETET